MSKTKIMIALVDFEGSYTRTDPILLKNSGITLLAIAEGSPFSNS
jgi:hypothetical protein